MTANIEILTNSSVTEHTVFIVYKNVSIVKVQCITSHNSMAASEVCYAHHPTIPRNTITQKLSAISALL